MFSTRVNAATAWMVLCHSAAVLIVSVPFAYLIHRTYGRHGPLVALAMTLTLFVIFALPAWRYLGDASTRQRVVTLLDQIKLIGVLPALVWLLGKLPPKQRLSGVRTSQAPIERWWLAAETDRWASRENAHRASWQFRLR
jgi:hypothetical protein